MTAANLMIKDPQAVLDYTWDWGTYYLEVGETITSSTVLVPAGITENSQTNDTTTVTVWLSGGEVGQTYGIVSRVTTTSGRTDERTIHIQVRER